MNIAQNINFFIIGQGKNGGRYPDERYSSFDYCFNYFQNFREEGKTSEIANSENLKDSCLNLGFYLASWGMYRGASFLLEKSARYLTDLIKGIAGMDTRIWDIDIDAYNDENIKLLLECRKMIAGCFQGERKPTDTLITKIMLGVFGNIPAFDRFVKDAFKLYYVNRAALKRLADFYEANKTIIDGYKIYTYDFLTGKETSRLYTKAKLVDMIGFMEGLCAVQNNIPKIIKDISETNIDQPPDPRLQNKFYKAT